MASIPIRKKIPKQNYGMIEEIYIGITAIITVADSSMVRIYKSFMDN